MATVHTLAEVAKHNTGKDCWIVIEGKVYDVTRFLEDHPGGDDVILSATGKDATDDFEDVGHSESARKMLEEFEIGEIDSSSIPKRLSAVDPNSQPKYNPDKSGEFIMRILRIVVPLVILVSALAFRYLNGKEEVTAEP